MKRLVLVTILSLAFLFPGCGTFLSWKRVGPWPYGGTATDISEAKRGSPSGFFLIFDLPFSFVFDTVTLPIIIPLWAVNGGGGC